MSARTNEIVRYALSYLLSNLGDALECCEGSDIENMTEGELQELHDAFDSSQIAIVLSGEGGISVPVCPPGITLAITEDDGEGYRYTSRYDHTGRLD